MNAGMSEVAAQPPLRGQRHPPPPAPRDALVRLFSFLPKGARRVTPGRVSREWRAAAAELRAADAAAAAAGAGAAAFADAAAATQMEDDDDALPYFPLWYVREVHGSSSHVPPHQRAAARLACRMAALYHGQLDALDFLFRASEHEFLVHNPPALVIAAAGGHVAALDWLSRRPNFASMQAKAKLPCMAAAGAGRIKALLWLRAKGYAWSHFTAAAAAGAGRLETLKFLRANGCEWNYEACQEAARGGHLAVLQHLRAEGCPWTPHTTLAALMGGHAAVFAWACANGAPL